MNSSLGLRPGNAVVLNNQINEPDRLRIEKRTIAMSPSPMSSLPFGTVVRKEAMSFYSIPLECSSIIIETGGS